MSTQPTEPTPVDLASFTDAQLAALLNMGGRARWVAVTELARRHPLATPAEAPPTPAERAAQGLTSTAPGLTPAQLATAG